MKPSISSRLTGGDLRFGSDGLDATGIAHLVLWTQASPSLHH
jgi:hypothetical protein